MAVKRYTPKYSKAYEYTDSETGETEIIAFAANANLMPVFKSMSGIELTDAIDEYTSNITSALDEQNLRAIVAFDSAPTTEEKLDAIKNNAEAFGAMMKTVNEMMAVKGSGLSLIELLLNASHICALPESDWAEASALGTELLPQEIYRDVAFAFEIIHLAFDWVEFAKKNSRR